MAKKAFRYEARLTSGIKLTRKGRTFLRGVPFTIDESEYKTYQADGLFTTSKIQISGETKQRQAAATTSRRRKTARERTEAKNDTSAANEAKKHTAAQVSAERLQKLAQADVDTTIKRGTLETMANQMGAKGPDGEPPEDANNKSTLVGWIRARQGVILADEDDDDNAEGDDNNAEGDDDNNAEGDDDNNAEGDDDNNAEGDDDNAE